ncbi:hypothetical protein [Cribrihabitans pelagius]|uniref:hypothetical protein n=1 Tax=Cribrihabitans pelagius TaxID=1765746 RepID=UPI003B594B2B
MSGAEAGAGAWLEGAGKGFAAASATWRPDSADGNGSGGYELSYYAAYGLRPRLTLGLDLNQSGRLSGHALLFARLPLRGQGRHRIALEAALGGSHQTGDWQPMQRLTLSYGHGFSTARRSGWLALDAAFELRQGGMQEIWKLDGTLGFNRPGAAAPMLQLEASKPEGQRMSAALTPVLRLPLPQQRELILGLEYRLRADRAPASGARHSLGLELGVWQKF